MSMIPKRVNPDLEKERKNASFDVEEFAAWFYGSKKTVEMKRLIEEELLSDLNDPYEHEYFSYEDVYNRAVKDTVCAITKLRKIQEHLNPGGSEIYPTIMGGPTGSALSPSGYPMGVHILMYTRAIKGQGTPEQFQKFGKPAHNFQMIGTYAQTELGHGTFLRGLETRADYDRETDEFILNTPTLTSYKWWPGGLGQTANHCIVVAQLYIDNDLKGIHMFVVQVRDQETHIPLPGIDIGDIGKKIGMLGVNNGFLGLKNVRVPREHMLMKHAQVHRDGSYIKSPVSQLTYFPMVFVRCMIAFGSAGWLIQAAVIATRYSAVRRQSPINPDEPEPQVIDHIAQQMKVFPEIATGIAYRLAAVQLIRFFSETEKAIENRDYSRLPELHALACTLKATCSYEATFGIERLRLACGGHGYLTVANFGNIFTSANAACTYEGENTVLYLQVGKILVKTWDDVLSRKPLVLTMMYLGECAAWKEFPKWTANWKCLVQSLQYAATNKTRIAHRSYQKRLQAGQSTFEAANNTGIELIQAAVLHGRAFVASTFLEEVTGPKASKRSTKLNRVLGNLLELYLINTIQNNMSDILRFIPLKDDDLTDLQDRLEIALKNIRPDAVAICDGFDYHDRALGSVLGCYDGNVYERIFESAKTNPLNKQPVPKAFSEYLKPFMKSNM